MEDAIEDFTPHVTCCRTYRKTSCNSRTRVIRAPHILGGKCGKKICKKNDSQKKFFKKVFKKREVTSIHEFLDTESGLPSIFNVNLNVLCFS